MPLVDSLLTAVVRSDGDALVLHVGEKPYVVAATGPVELSRQGLGLGAMEGMLAQLLTADALRTLREMGAVEHELDDRPAASGDRFTVVAARGGDDIWIELRRHRRVPAPAHRGGRATDAPVAEPAPVAAAPAPAASTPVAPIDEPRPAVELRPAVTSTARAAEPAPAVVAPAPVVAAPVAFVASAAEIPAAVTLPPAEEVAPAPPVAAAPESAVAAAPEPVVAAVPESVVAAAPGPAVELPPAFEAPSMAVADTSADALPALDEDVIVIDAADLAAQELGVEAGFTAMEPPAEPLAPVRAAPEPRDTTALEVDEVEAAIVEAVAAGPVADVAPGAPVAEVVEAEVAAEVTAELPPAVVTPAAPAVAESPAAPAPPVTVAAAAPSTPAETVAPPSEPAAPVEPEPVVSVAAAAPAPVVTAAAAAPLPVAAAQPEPVAAAAAPAPAAAPPAVPAPVAAAPVVEARDVAPVPEAPVVPVAPSPRPAASVVPSPLPAAAAPPLPVRPVPVPAPAVEPAPAARDTAAAAWPPAVSRVEAPDVASVPESHPMLPGLADELDAMGRDSHASVLDAPDQLPAVVLSLTRDGARGAAQGTRGTVRPGGIERLLRLAAARGASALYLTTQARPAVRVDGDIRLLDGEPALSSGDVEAAVLELAPEGARDKESAEWIRDLADVGRVRITTFRDYRGPGALLRMIQARATSAEQLGLVREIQALATEPEGLVIVTGPRASGKSTLVSAFVDLINRQRNDYVITLEGQIRLVHESRGSLISQRELRGNAQEVVSAARAALRENPDVLIIEDLRSPDVLQVALDAAGSGLLVFASVTAASATAALERLVDLCPSEQRRTVRAALAEHLRGVVAQVLLRKAGGGRLAARELVLNTNAVAALISDGQIAQLPRAIDSGRKLGMAPLNDALVAFVQSGAVDVREAYRKADDKAGLLALLRREGIDTSFVERLA